MTSALLLPVLLAVLWTGWRALEARDRLLATAAGLEVLRGQIAARDFEAAGRTLSGLQDDSEAARRLTAGPLWAAAGHLPVAGDDFRAAHAVAEVVADVTHSALPPAVEAGALLSATPPADGRVALAPLSAAGPLVREASDQLARASATADGIDTAGVGERISAPVGSMQAQLAAAADAARPMAEAVELLPGMLGREGPRSYLVLFQNNAEARATGGMPGAFAVLTADAGRIELQDQLPTTGTFPRFAEPVLSLPPETLSLHSERVGVYFSDTNLTPHFPTTGELAREMWRRVSGQEVDGVLSVDPVALSYLLTATGPVALASGEELRPEEVVDVLLSETYARYPDPPDQDAFFAQAAAGIFAALVEGEVGSPVGLLGSVQLAVDERRLLAWSGHPQEQELLSAARVGGALPASDGDRPFVGVFLNDGTAAKMHFYLRQEVRVAASTCAVDGYRHLSVDVTLTSAAPPDAGVVLPVSVTGDGAGGLPPGVIRSQVLVYGSVDGAVRTVEDGAGLVPFLAKEEQGRPVAVFFADLLPGESRTFTVGLLASLAQTGEPEVRTTPGVAPSLIAVEQSPCP